MKQLLKVMTTGLLLFAYSCSPYIRVKYDYDQNLDFSGYHTYDWVTRPKGHPADAREAMLKNDLLEQRIKSAVNKTLAEKGLSQVSDSPDIFVAYHTGVEDKIKVVNWGYTYPSHYWGGRRVDVYQYEEGTLIIDFIDAKSKRLVWRASASATLSKRAKPEEMDKNIKRAVSKMLSPFPPSNL